MNKHRLVMENLDLSEWDPNFSPNFKDAFKWQMMTHIDLSDWEDNPPPWSITQTEQGK